MAYKVAELGSKREYEEWLTSMGDRIRVVSAVPSRKKWSPWTGMMNLENAQTYTVTYEEVTLKPSQGSGIFCGQCGTAVQAGNAFCGKCGARVQNK